MLRRAARDVTVGRRRLQPLRGFAGQVSWSLAARVLAAALQLAVIILLARGLPPGRFAVVSTVNVILLMVTAINGFGLIRQIQYRRSVDRDDPTLPALYAARLRYAHASALGWVAAMLALWAITENGIYPALLPAAIWLLTEQITQTWNGISIVDGRAHELVWSYLARRAPVVVVLGFALVADLDVVLAWTVGLALGGILAFAQAVRRQEPWARHLLPPRRQPGSRVSHDYGYWLSQVGDQLRDFDVPALALVVDIHTAGIYALPARLLRPMNMIAAATAQIAFPALSRRRHVSRRELVLGVLAGSLPSVVVALVVLTLAGFLPVLVGGEYEASVPIMRILCVCAALWAPCTLLVTFLQSRSDDATNLLGAIVVALSGVQIVAVCVGGVADGATGAAIGSTLVQAVTLVTLSAMALAETTGGLRRSRAIAAGRRSDPR
jgi:O-antigen/teichoic acid export membrane protein